MHQNSCISFNTFRKLHPSLISGVTLASVIGVLIGAVRKDPKFGGACNQNPEGLPRNAICGPVAIGVTFSCRLSMKAVFCIHDPCSFSTRLLFIIHAHGKTTTSAHRSSAIYPPFYYHSSLLRHRITILSQQHCELFFGDRTSTIRLE